MSCIPIQDFSLISLCDATKAGKLYSIVPDTGAGDFDVTRASTATYLGSDGLLKTAANDEPRIEFNPDGSYKGLLVEPSATNLLPRSEDFNDAVWEKISSGTGINAVVTTNADIAPDGTMTADRIVFDKNGGTDFTDASLVRNIQFTSGLINQTYTGTIFVKSNTGQPQDFLFFINRGSQVSSKVVTLTNEFQRIELSITLQTAGRVDFQMGTRGSSGSNDFLDVLAWGAQLEESPVATSYIPTVASTVTRAADVISQDLSGVLPSTYSLILKVNANGGRLRMDDGTTGFDIDLTGTGQIVANVEANTITFTFPDNGQPLTELVFEKYTDFNDLEFVQKIAGLHVEVIAMTNSVLSASEIADKVFGSVSTSFIETDWGSETDFLNAFRRNGYEYFPLIDTSSVNNFTRAWNINNLTSFPLIDTSSGTNFNGAWRDNNLTSFPLIDTSSATNFNDAWRDNNLTNFPLIDTSSVTDFTRAWFDNNLTSFPLIDTSSATTFRDTWFDNNLQTWPANMFDNCPATDFVQTWRNNALDATGVNNILISINKARVDGVSSGTGTIGLNDGTNAAPTGAGLTAKNELIAAGWTVNTN